MANLKNFDNERYADVIKEQRGKANTLGPDTDEIAEPFGKTKTTLLNEVFLFQPEIEQGLIAPKYSDSPSEGSVGTRYVQQRLHTVISSGKTGSASCQTFMAVSTAPNSDSSVDIEEVRIKHLISPRHSPDKSDAAHADPNFRGFQVALYPAQSNGGVGNALIVDDSNGPIPVSADPSAQYGIGDEYWYVDYEDGVIRLSAAPVSGSDYLFNPNSVYGDIDGVEVGDDAYGRVTLFATFYKHDGSTGTDLIESQFVTVGDGINSSGTFTGSGAFNFQSAVDHLAANNGGTVFIKDGYYDFNDGYVNVSENIEIRGHNNVFIKSAQQEAIFKIQGNGVKISNINMEIASSVIYPSSAVMIAGSRNGYTLKDVLVENCKILVDADAYGVSFYPSANDLAFENISISNNIFRDDNSAGWPGANNPAFIGLADPTVDEDGVLYQSSFKNINISNNVFESTQTQGISLISLFSTADGIYVRDNVETAGGNASVTIWFKNDNPNIKLSNNIMPNSIVHIKSGVMSGNKFLSESVERLASDSVNFNSDGGVVSYGGTTGVSAYSNGIKYIAAGGFGTAEIAISNNATKWSNIPNQPSAGTLRCIEYDGKGLWVSAGVSGTIITSEDGRNWTTRSPDGGFVSTFEDIHYNGALWSAVGSSQEIQTSPDGVTWTQQTSDTGAGGSASFAGIDYFNNTWVLVGTDGVVQTSPDGVNWTDRSFAGGFSDPINCVFHNNNLFIVAGESGEIQTSPDGINWTSRSAGGGFANGFYGGGSGAGGLSILVGSGGEIQTSPDGITWTQQTSGVTVGLRDIEYNGYDTWVASGPSGTIVVSLDNGVTWAEYKPENRLSTNTIYYGIAIEKNTNAALVASGYSNGGTGIFAKGGTKSPGGRFHGGSSGDGIVSKGGGTGSGVRALGDGTKYVIVGDSASGVEIQYSDTTISWDNTTLNVPTTASYDLNEVEYDGKGRFVAVGAPGLILTSTDAVYWEQADVDAGYTGAFSDVMHDGMRTWVAVGSSGEIQTSVDGITWKQVRSGGSNLTAIDCRRGTWIAVGASGTILLSHDTINWEAQTPDNSLSSQFSDITHNDDTWFICATDHVQISTNGEDWLEYDIPIGGTQYIDAACWDSYAKAFTIIYDDGFNVYSASTDLDGWSTPKSIRSSQLSYSIIDDGAGKLIMTSSSGEVWVSEFDGAWQQRTLAGSFSDDVNGICAIYGTNSGIVTTGSSNSGDGLVAYGGVDSNGNGVRAYGSGNGAGVLAVGGDGYGPGILACNGGPGSNAGEFRSSESGGGILTYGSGGNPGVNTNATGTGFVVVGGPNNESEIEIQRSFDGKRWEYSTHDVSSDDWLKSVAHDGAGTFVGAGAGGTIVTSSDGINWLERSPDASFTDEFACVAHDGIGTWVIVGDSGEIQTSPDGITWTHIDSPTLNDLYCVTSNKKGVWAAGGQNGTLITSFDTINWEFQTLDSAYSSGVRSITYNGSNLWLLTGSSGVVQTSPDAKNWTSQVVAGGYTGTLYGSAWDNVNGFTIVGSAGEIQTSSDGVTWTQQTAGGSYSGIFRGMCADGAGNRIAVGQDAEIQVSTDGSTWTKSLPHGDFSGYFFSVCSVNGSNAGLVASGSPSNGSGVVGIGGGTAGVGVRAKGTGTGAGLVASGGVNGGNGIVASDGIREVGNYSSVFHDGYLLADDYIDGYISIHPLSCMPSDPANVGISGTGISIGSGDYVYIPLNLKNHTKIIDIESLITTVPGATITLNLYRRRWNTTGAATLVASYSTSSAPTTLIASISDINEVVSFSDSTNTYIYWLELYSPDQAYSLYGTRIRIGWKSTHGSFTT